MPSSLLFWDVDTQFDFLHPAGKLYVPGAETIISNLHVHTSTTTRSLGALCSQRSRKCGSLSAPSHRRAFQRWPQSLQERKKSHEGKIVFWLNGFSFSTKCAQPM